MVCSKMIYPNAQSLDSRWFAELGVTGDVRLITKKTKMRKNSAIFAPFNFLTLHLLFSCGVPPSDVARDEHDVENEK